MRGFRTSIGVGLVLAAAMLSACGQQGDPAPAAEDAGLPPADAGGPPPADQEVTMELGTGEAFAPVSNGDRVALTRGFQGLQHVLVSVRVHDMPAERVIVALTLTRDRDGMQVSEPFRAGLPFDAQTGGFAERLGLELVVPDPEAILGEQATLTAHCEGRDGSWAEAEAASVIVVWEDDLPGGG